MKDKRIIFSMIPVLINILLGLGVITVFSACERKEDGAWMRCHSAQMAVTICAVVLALLFLIIALVKIKVVRIILNLIALIVSIVTFLIPGTIMKMCMMNTMRCYTVMQPFVRIMTCICAVFAIIGIIRAGSGSRTE